MFSTISHYAVLVKINSFSIFAHDGLAKEKKTTLQTLAALAIKRGAILSYATCIGRLKT